MHPGKWSNPCRNALTTSILALSCQISLTFAMRDATLGTANLNCFRMDVSSRRSRSFASGQSKFPSVSPTLSGRIYGELSGMKNIINKCDVLDIHHCAFHTGEKPRLVFGGQSDCVCFQSLSSYVFRCHRKHGFCSFREGHKHLLLQSKLTRQSAKPPPRLIAFIAGTLDSSMTH